MQATTVPTPASSPTSLPTSLAEVGVKTREYWDKAYQLVTEHGPNVLLVLAIVFIAWVGSAWARRMVRMTLERAKFDATLGKFLSNMVRWTILALALIACLDRFGIQTTSFAALIGVAGLAIGLSLQGSLSHLAAGVMLLIFRPFKVGDGIVVAGQTGTVNEIDLFTTSLDTPDGRRVILPNASVFGSVIENSTHHTTRRFEISLNTAATATASDTRRVLESAARGATGVLPDPAPAVQLTGMSAASFSWNVTVWCKQKEIGNVREALLLGLRDGLEKAKIALA